MSIFIFAIIVFISVGLGAVLKWLCSFKEEVSYIFPVELFDAEWPENELIKTNYEEFKKRKKKAFQKELP